MRQIYEAAQSVIIWLGPDAEDPKAKSAAAAILEVSNAVCHKLGVSISDLSTIPDLYNDFIFKNRDRLPTPEEITLGTDATWESLVWLYSNPYFTRVWVVQEINANVQRSVHCGYEEIDWNRLQLVAGYIIADTAWSKRYGFTKTHCWWVGRIAASGFTHAKTWLQMLYLASNFASTDLKDQVFGLCGLIKAADGADLLRPDYSKSTLSVYRDTVEAAFLDFQNTDILNFTPDTKMASSWVPEWNRPMLFRNPFRFGKVLPWKPAGETKVVWKIDRNENILYLTGVVVDSIKWVEPYNENYFCNSIMESEEAKITLGKNWQRILRTLEASQPHLPFNSSVLTAVATSLSFGLDEKADPMDEHLLLLNFVAYLRTALDEETFNKYVPAEISQEATKGDGKAFGKPVWDFDYPESSLFITSSGLIGCSTVTNKPGDIVFIPLGSTYPLVLRPDGGHYLLKGFSFVHGKMIGNSPRVTQVVEIR